MPAEKGELMVADNQRDMPTAAAKITDIEGLKVGTSEDMAALTGCTIILVEEGAVCGVDVRGSAPGTRETDLLSPLNMMQQVQAVLLTGGSAFGLDAAGGVMRYLEERGIGHPTGKTVVPIVPAAVLFDLNVGDYRVRPEGDMGYQACKKAGQKVSEGNVGAGTGATVGKIRGFEFCTKSGQGSHAVRLENGLIVGALVAVNAFGDVVNPDSGEVIAGVRSADGSGFVSTVQLWKQNPEILAPPINTNTTIAVVATNARLDKSQAAKVAQMAHNGMARTISPCHTMFDGDTVFALATGQIEADVNLVGVLGQEVLARAILRAVYTAETVQGLRCCRE